MAVISPPAVPAAPAAAPRLQGSLGPVAIVFMVVAAASPLTVIGGGAPLGIALGNGAGFPALFLPVAAVLLLFAVGFMAMTRVVERPGAFYTYIGEGLGRHLGTGAAWLAVLCYTSIQLGVLAYLGALLARTGAAVGLPAVPWWVWTLVVVGAVGVLGYRRIDVSSKVLGVLLVCEILVVVAITSVAVLGGGADGLALDSFTPATALSGSPGVGLLFAIAAYIGFEATAIYRDEARDPDRTIPRATYGALLGVTGFYAVGIWGIVVAWGPQEVVRVALSDPSMLLQATAGLTLGAAGPVVVDVLIMTSMLACVLSFHNVLARYLHSMSGAGLLPAPLEDVHPRHASPHRASVVQSLTAAVLTLLFAACGLDPVLEAFTWFSGVGTLAVVLLMLGTSIAALAYFARHREQAAELGRWRSAIAPALGAIGLAALGVVLAANFPMLVGDVGPDGAPAFGVLSTVLVGLCLAAVLVGTVQSLVLRRPAALDAAAPAAVLTTPTLIGETDV
ncbi:APC family permease [Brachybacterium rhamnosum]|uniref:APC family permease n=1 Tax=Brachybacterium rhamnosum TaxID=173361 RepID=A0ABW4PXC1_9MICO